MYYIKTSLEGRVLHHNLHYSTELFLLKHKPTNQPTKKTNNKKPSESQKPGQMIPAHRLSSFWTRCVWPNPDQAIQIRSESV